MWRSTMIQMVLVAWVMWLGDFSSGDMVWRSLAPEGTFDDADFPSLTAERACSILAESLTRQSESAIIYLCLPEREVMQKRLPADAGMSHAPGTVM
jgi:hypothetical protein